MAVRTSSSVRPSCASAVGWPGCARPGGGPPAIATRPTPCTCDSLGARRFSTRSFTRITGSEGEVMASVRMGASAGLTLLYSGGAGQVAGQQVAARVDGRLHLLLGHVERHVERKRSVITEAPPELVDDICDSPGIWPNCRSSGAVTLRSSRPGSRPGTAW